MTGTQLNSRGRRWAVALASTALLGTAALVPTAYADEGKRSGNNKKLSTSLVGEREVPGPGDPDGRGKARIKLKESQVCFQLSWRNIEAPTAAHIHVGSRRVAGPVVVGLFGGTSPLDANVTSVGGCADADPALIAEIRKRPRAYYVNIHNATYPGGAIRGQLHR